MELEKSRNTKQNNSRKPKVWNVAILSAILVVVLFIVTRREPIVFQPIAVMICIYLVAVIGLLQRALFKQLRYNPYSYNTIYYIGFSLFLLSVLIAQIISAARAWNTPGDQAVYNAFFSLLCSAKTYIILSTPFLVMFSTGLCLSNLSLIRHEGRRPVNLLGIVLSILLLGGLVFLFFGDRYATGSMLEVMRHDLLFNLFAALYLYFECMLIGTIIANLIVLRHKPEMDQDYIIVLG